MRWAKCAFCLHIIDGETTGSSWTTSNKSVALESESPTVPDRTTAPPCSVEHTAGACLRLSVCPPLWNMCFWLQNVLLLNNVSALELGTPHKGHFVPGAHTGRSPPHHTHTHTHTGPWWHQQLVLARPATIKPFSPAYQSECVSAVPLVFP